MSIAILGRVHLFALFIAFVFGLVGLGAGVNSFIKGKIDKQIVDENEGRFGVDIRIGTRGIDAEGGAILAGCALLSIAAFASFIEVYSLRVSLRKYESWILGLITLWLLIVNIGYTFVALKHGAKVETTPAVSAATLSEIKKALDIGERYWDEGYVRSLGSAAWVTFATSVLATATSIWAPKQKKEENIEMNS